MAQSDVGRRTAQPGAVEGDAEAVVAQGFDGARQPFGHGLAGGLGEGLAGVLEIRGDGRAEGGPDREGQAVRLDVEGLEVGDAVEVMGHGLALGIEEHGHLGLGLPVDGSEGLGLLGEGLGGVPGQGLGALGGGQGGAGTARGGQVRHPALGQVHGAQAAVLGQAGLDDGVDVAGHEGREALGTVEVAAMAVEDVAEGPGGVLGALGDDALHLAVHGGPLGADVDLVLGPFLGAAVDDQGWHRAVLRRQVVVLDPDAGDALLGLRFDQGVDHEEVARFAHGDPRHRGDLGIARDLGQGLQLLLAEGRRGRQVLDPLALVVLGVAEEETWGAPNDAEVVGGAHGADGGVAHQAVLGDVVVEDEEPADLLTAFGNPQVGRGLAGIAAVGHRRRAVHHPLEDLVDGGRALGGSEGGRQGGCEGQEGGEEQRRLHVV